MSSPRPGPRNLITDVDGILVGNAEDHRARTGVTVVLPETSVVMAAAVTGGAPGTRETDALDPTCLVQDFHGLVLSGGSVFGLGAADGVAAWLSARGRGLAMGPRAIPVVPAAILFDLNNGGDKDWGETPPYAALGRAAAEAAGRDFPLGNAGAGFGAKAGRIKGGLGSASLVSGPLQVGALAGVNPVGSVTLPGQPQFWAWALERDGEFGALPAPAPVTAEEPALPAEGRIGGHTTICAIATNATLDKAGALRVALMAHDGIARAVRPAHTPFDGDSVFVLATGRVPLAEIAPTAPLALATIGHMAADCLARAIARGVHAAEVLGDVPSWRDVWG
jgi:L-aminopeptidase/D-esterase-like protein